MRKKIIGMVLTMTVAVSVFSSPAFADKAVSSEQKETSATLTEEWFGESKSQGIISEDAARTWGPVVSAYEESRELQFLGGTVQNQQMVFGSLRKPVVLDTEAVLEDEQRRQACIAAMEARMGIEITDAQTTTQIKNVTEENGRYVLDVYEWTFFDYIDLAGDGQSEDVSGYGVDHRLTLEKTETGYEILSDTYDEGKLTGMASSDYIEPEKTVVQGNKEIARQAGVFTYDPDKAAAYADRYVKQNISGTIESGSYNPNYRNFNDVGGDCTNYVSQCIYAGGLPMDDRWFYKDATYYSAAWTTSRVQYPYMSGFGKAVENPTSKDIKKGSPVYYSNGDHIVHATICVGKNEAGTPIINSHNNDYYHVKWNYWGQSTIYYTVQLPASTQATPPLNLTGSRKMTGDIDGDGTITAIDALEVLRVVVALDAAQEEKMALCDVDGNGKVTSQDSLLVLEKTVGLISAFPVEKTAAGAALE